MWRRKEGGISAGNPGRKPLAKSLLLLSATILGPLAGPQAFPAILHAVGQLHVVTENLTHPWYQYSLQHPSLPPDRLFIHKTLDCPSCPSSDLAKCYLFPLNHMLSGLLRPDGTLLSTPRHHLPSCYAPRHPIRNQIGLCGPGSTSVVFPACGSLLSVFGMYRSPSANPPTI